MLDRLLDFVNRSNDSNSNTDKLGIIKEFSKDTGVMQALRYTYTPYKQYYVSSKNCKKRSDLVANECNYNTLFDLLDDLSSRKITGHRAIAEVNKFVEVNRQYEDLIWSIIDRNLKTRSTTQMINKIVPGLIPTFDVALADTYKEETKKKVNWRNNWYVSRKIDGCLHQNSIIEFEDGRKLTIKNIVDNKIKGNIKSYNTETKNIEYKPINDWMFNLEDINKDNNEWFEIILENGKKIILTGNHRIWLPKLKCWRRTDELNGDEELLINN